MSTPNNSPSGTTATKKRSKDSDNWAEESKQKMQLAENQGDEDELMQEKTEDPEDTGEEDQDDQYNINPNSVCNFDHKEHMKSTGDKPISSCSLDDMIKYLIGYGIEHQNPAVTQNCRRLLQQVNNEPYGRPRFQRNFNRNRNNNFNRNFRSPYNGPRRNMNSDDQQSGGNMRNNNFNRPPRGGFMGRGGGGYSGRGGRGGYDFGRNRPSD